MNKPAAKADPRLAKLDLRQQDHAARMEAFLDAVDLD
jgi:hypothetical protein